MSRGMARRMRRLIFVSAAVVTMASCGGSDDCTDRPDRRVKRWGTPPPRDTASDYMVDPDVWIADPPPEFFACPLVWIYDNRP